MIATHDTESFLSRMEATRSQCLALRRSGDEAAAETLLKNAYLRAVARLDIEEERASQLAMLRAAAELALDLGQVEEARTFARRADSLGGGGAWEEIADANRWPDVWLISAVKREPPDLEALNALAARYWKKLYARCRMLALDYHAASDLAQDSWCRVLRSRASLRPGGNFPGLVSRVAANLWRDRHRAARRAGPMAEHRIASLDASIGTGGRESFKLSEAVPDLGAVAAAEQQQLMQEIDRGLRAMRPMLREVLVARLIDGESCAEIGRRHGRTEQTVSRWVREGIEQLKQHLRESGCFAAPSA